MGNSSYFWFDDDKTKYIYSLNHNKENGLTEKKSQPNVLYNGKLREFALS